MNHARKNRTAVSAATAKSHTGNEPLAKNEIAPLVPPVDIVITSYRKRMFDTDGPNAKAHIDGLVAIGLLPGDTAKVIRQITFRSEIAAEERTIIEIVEVP